MLEVPVPEVGLGDVRVRVRASSINGFDIWVASGMARQMTEHRYPLVVGKDFGGVVERVGEGVTRFAVGDEVVGIVPTDEVLWRGSFGELVVVPAEGFIEAKPANLELGIAAALGLAGLAALVSVETTRPTSGHDVLIVGATGGVGAYAVQLASARGANVIATGLPEDEVWLRDLGAHEVVDYSGDVVAQVRERHPDGVDALLHFVNLPPEAFASIVELVKDSGTVASTLGAADEDGLAVRGVAATNVFAQADPAPFARVIEIARRGELVVPVTGTYTLGDLHEGIELCAKGLARGKLTLSLEG